MALLRMPEGAVVMQVAGDAARGHARSSSGWEFFETRCAWPGEQSLPRVLASGAKMLVRRLGVVKEAGATVSLKVDGPPDFVDPSGLLRIGGAMVTRLGGGGGGPSVSIEWGAAVALALKALGPPLEEGAGGASESDARERRVDVGSVEEVGATEGVDDGSGVGGDNSLEDRSRGGLRGGAGRRSRALDPRYNHAWLYIRNRVRRLDGFDSDGARIEEEYLLITLNELCGLSRGSKDRTQRFA